MQHLFLPQHIIRKNKLDSTNNYALKLINETNPVNGTVILTFNQTNGKGQSKNKWISESGKNLTFSMILRPNFLPNHLQFYLSKVISLGVTDFLHLHSNNVKIKWPNDIYVDNKKIAGILIENFVVGNSISYSVCGVGININQKSFDPKIPNPTSMAILLNKEFDLENSFWSLLRTIEQRYRQLEAGMLEVLDADYIDVLYRGKGFYAFSNTTDTFDARIKDVSETGQLILETRSGEEKIFNFQEVKFLS